MAVRILLISVSSAVERSFAIGRSAVCGAIYQYLCLVFLVLASFSSEAPLFADESEVISKIRQSHSDLERSIFSNISVFVAWKDIEVPSGKIQADRSKYFGFRGGSLLMKEKGEVMASNGDYRFRLDGGDEGLAYLEGKRNRNAAAEEFERSNSRLAKASVQFGGSTLTDVLQEDGFKIDSIDTRADAVVISGTWAKKSESYSEIVINLDPNNHYQIVSSRYRITRPTYSVDVHEISRYNDADFEDTGIRLISAIDQELADENSKLKTEITYSQWARIPLEEDPFRLATYGIPEPDLEALNKPAVSALFIVATVLVGIVGLILLLFGKKFTRKF